MEDRETIWHRINTGESSGIYDVVTIELLLDIRELMASLRNPQFVVHRNEEGDIMKIESLSDTTPDVSGDAPP